MGKRLLAVFGAGCQMLTINGPWAPSGDFERWPLGKNGGRSIVREASVDDEDPNAVIGLGELTLEAALIHYPRVRPDAVAIAYGDSSPSLQLAGHPSESEVMSSLFQQRLPGVKLEVWDPIAWNSNGKLSGTYNEAANLLRLMKRDGFDEMCLLHREAHLRAATLTMMRLQEPEFADLAAKIRTIQMATVEEVVLRDVKKYGSRIKNIRESKAYRRFLLREGSWWYNFTTKGVSQIVQKPVESAVTSSSNKV